ncbi:MAG TPA: rod shape-determining protein MreD [Acidimicrobiales bacterium]|nr:rod shape-determining protein MreD [Acidimicrobiales bacterium]
MNGRRSVWLRSGPVLVAALVLQVSVVADLRVAGAIGDLLLVVVVAAAVTGGAERGAAYGFAAGLLYDLAVETPFGLTALTYTLVGLGVGALAALIGRTGGWWPVGLAAGAGFAQATAYTVLGNLVGVAYPAGDVPVIGLVMAAWAAVLVLPLLRVLWWIHGHAAPDRLEVLLR